MVDLVLGVVVVHSALIVQTVVFVPSLALEDARIRVVLQTMVAVTMQDLEPDGLSVRMALTVLTAVPEVIEQNFGQTDQGVRTHVNIEVTITVTMGDLAHDLVIARTALTVQTAVSGLLRLLLVHRRREQEAHIQARATHV